LDQHRYGAALDALRHGAALEEDLPFHGVRARQLREQLRRAEWGQASEELHLFAERVRPLYTVDRVPREQARSVEALCRDFWQARGPIGEHLRHQASPELEEQVRTDLLDLAVLWADLHVRLAPSDQEGVAREAALAVLAEAEGRFGPSCVLYQERGRHARALGRAEEARAAERDGAARPPRSAWEHHALGRAYLQAGDLHRAAEQIDRSLELRPDNLWPNFDRGHCAFRLGQYEDAVTSFSICTALAPRSAWCYYSRGLAYAKLGRPERARRDSDRARALDPGFAAAALAAE
jgi:tetratricopeptide (TPR) repeat protein